jgi:transcription elongation GreA/GreB family factor
MSNLAPAATADTNADVQKLVDEGKIAAATARTLSALPPGTYCQHKSWGFGRVAAWNLEGNQILIDFGPRKSHPMQLQYASETLKPVPKDHLLARKDSDLPSVKKMAADDAVGLVRSILDKNPGQKATVTQISALLIPDVLAGETEFKRWWESTKKLLKKDGCFVVPAKKTDFVELRSEALGQHQALFGQFFQGRQLKEQLAALDEIHKSVEEFKENPSALEPVLNAAGQAAARNQRLDLSASFELLVTRDEIADAIGLTDIKQSPSLTTLMREEEARLSEIIADLPAAKQRFALHRLPDALGEDRWAPRALSLLPQTHNARVVGEIARLFEARGRTDDLRGYLDRCIRDYSITCEMLLWLCKERSEPKYASFANPRLFSAILSALERDLYSDIKRSTKLRDLLSSDRELVTGLLGEAEQSELRAAARALLATPSLEELDKRSLMARLIKLHPDLHVLLTGGGEDRPTTLIVSWSSLEKRKLELDDLVNRQIPKNIEEISVARSYGDLRENFEFKAAKEMQTVLARRRSELEQDLARSRGTNFENPDLNQVSIGTVVSVTDIASGNPEEYTILGAWDGNPEKGILSYLTVIGQALLGHRIGETIELPSETGQGSRAAKIDAIVAYQPPAT